MHSSTSLPAPFRILKNNLEMLYPLSEVFFILQQLTVLIFVVSNSMKLTVYKNASRTRYILYWKLSSRRRYDSAHFSLFSSLAKGLNHRSRRTHSLCSSSAQVYEMPSTVWLQNLEFAKQCLVIGLILHHQLMTFFFVPSYPVEPRLWGWYSMSLTTLIRYCI